MAIVVVPKFSSTSSLSTYALRDQIIAQLRLAQWRQINDTASQYQISVDNQQKTIGISISGLSKLASKISFEPNHTVIPFKLDSGKQKVSSFTSNPQQLIFDMKLKRYEQSYQFNPEIELSSGIKAKFRFLQISNGSTTLYICMTRGGVIDDCSSGDQCILPNRKLVSCSQRNLTQ